MLNLLYDLCLCLGTKLLRSFTHYQPFNILKSKYTCKECPEEAENTVMCLSIGTPKHDKFPFVPNGK